jgi:hypothetical protein
MNSFDDLLPGGGQTATNRPETLTNDTQENSMSQLLEHIDAIARKKQRDVVTVEFHNFEISYRLYYRLNPARKIVIDWLDANAIVYEECGAYASETEFDSYRGQIYVDVPCDVNDPVYLKLEAFMENQDGATKFDTAWLRGYRLEYCMKNAHHDVPGLSEDLMEKFQVVI